MTQTTQYRFQLWGWILFIASATFFMAASIRAGDPLSLIGGVLFLLACFVFLAPLLAQLAVVDDQAEVSSLSPPNKYSRYRPDWFRAVNLQSHEPGATSIAPVRAHQPDQNRHHLIRSELRFFASTR
jgi:hypothetical protein